MLILFGIMGKGIGWGGLNSRKPRAALQGENWHDYRAEILVL